MVTEEHSRVDSDIHWKKSTFVYTATTFFEVKETRTQVLKLLGWDPVNDTPTETHKATIWIKPKGE
jgi:hypothetical protein